jgi:hypothetical protein
MRPRPHRLGILTFLLAAAAQLPAADLATLLDRLSKHQEAIRPVYDGGFIKKRIRTKTTFSDYALAR